jgi:hypothetical protein
MSLTWGLPTASRVGFALCASIRRKPIGHYGLAEDRTQPSYYYQGYMNILLNEKQRKIMDFSMVSKFIMEKKNSFYKLFKLSDTHKNKGVCHTVGLAIYIEMYLKAKERIMETHIFHHAKI